jgi:RND family efflux transporter MFP subunit
MDQHLALGLAALPAIFTLGCAPVRSEAVAAAGPPDVECVVVHSQRSPGAIELPGAVAAVRMITLTAPAAGHVRVLAEEGSQVPAGGEAAALDATGLPEQVDAARAALDAAHYRRAGARTAEQQSGDDRASTVAMLEQSLRVAEAQRDRAKALLAESRVSAAVEPARLQAQVRAAEAHVRQLRSGEREQRIRQLEAELDVKLAELTTAQTQMRRDQALYAQGYLAKSVLELGALSVRRARASHLQTAEELKLQREGAHPEAIAEAEGQSEAARQALRGADAFGQQVSQREADLVAAEAEVVKARGNLEVGRANRAPQVRARQEAAAMDADARRWQAQWTEVRERMARTTIRAPFAGQVVRRRVRPGETVNPGTPLLDLVDPRRLQFEAGAAETDVTRLRTGDPVEIRLLAVPGGIRGRVEEVILSSEPIKGAYRVRLSLVSTAGLRPGMVGTARVERAGAVAPPQLPLASLRRYFPREGRGEVLVAEGDRLALRPVRLGELVGARVSVTAGLHDGDRVVINPGGLAPGGAARAREVAEQ